MKKKLVIGIIAMIIIGGLGVGISGVSKNKSVRNNMNEVTALQDSIVSTASGAGKVEAEKREKVTSTENAIITEVKVNQYDVVKEGDVLMVTSSGTSIKAPIDGEVSNLYVNEGDKINMGAELLDVTDYSSLQLITSIDGLDISKIEVGQEVIANINEIQEKEYTGKIASISKEGVYQNGVSTFEIKVALDNIDNLLIGMSADVKVQLSKVDDAVLVPIEAIQYDEDNTPYVLVKSEKNEPQKVEVELGLQDGINVEIKSGLNKNDVVEYPKEVQEEKSTGFSMPMPPRPEGGK